MSELKNGTRVTLIKFNGTLKSHENSAPDENYWLLIGSSGTVLECKPPAKIMKNRVLVKFDRMVSELGLQCHNEIPNALWIDRHDLKPKLR